METLSNAEMQCRSVAEVFQRGFEFFSELRTFF